MKRFDQINVIPFIDIMLVLLAIVLTTASFIDQGLIRVDLPSASSSAQTHEENPLVISIDHNGQIYLKERSVSIELLSKQLQAYGPETQVSLRVDKSVSFDKFVAVVDSLKENKLDRLSIMTK